MIGVELISTLLGKVLLGYEHNYIVHAFLYATEKCRVRTQKIGGARGRGKSNLQRLQRLQLSTSQITNFHQNHLLEPSSTRIQLVPMLDTAPLRHAGNTCSCHYEAENSNGRVDPQPPSYSDAWLSAIRAAVSINFINVAHDDVIIIPSTAAPLPSTIG